MHVCVAYVPRGTRAGLIVAWTFNAASLVGRQRRGHVVLSGPLSDARETLRVGVRPYVAATPASPSADRIKTKAAQLQHATGCTYSWERGLRHLQLPRSRV